MCQLHQQFTAVTYDCNKIILHILTTLNSLDGAAYFARTIYYKGEMLMISNKVHNITLSLMLRARVPGKPKHPSLMERKGQDGVSSDITWTRL
jgi:hypothetical protein